jgi:hypothetical protein
MLFSGSVSASADDTALILLVCTCYIIFAFIEIHYGLHQRDIASTRGKFLGIAVKIYLSLLVQMKKPRYLLFARHLQQTNPTVAEKGHKKQLVAAYYYC